MTEHEAARALTETAQPQPQPQPRTVTVTAVQPLRRHIEAARQRVDALVDQGSFLELGSMARSRSTVLRAAGPPPAGDGVVTGLAGVDGRPVTVFAQESSQYGGSLGETHAAKIVQLLGHAERAQVPVVGLVDSAGARLQEGVAALDGYGAVFRANVRLSGRVPQISVILGSCAGGAVYSPALTDIVIMERERARLFLTGPKVVKAVTHEDVDAAGLGGAEVHSRSSGVAHLVAGDTTDALGLARQVLSYLPTSCWSPPPLGPSLPAGALPAVPDNPRQGYDVRAVVRGLVDSSSFLELQPRFARNVVVGFARLHGRPVGVVANQPSVLAGTIDIAAAEKAARFVRLCDAFGLPLVTLVDTPGFLPGKAQEAGGIIRKGAKLLYAYAEASVPRVTVVLRKAFGGAYIVMNSKALGADAVFAWPGAELAVMGAEAAVDLLHRRQLGDDPGLRDGLVARYREEAMSPAVAVDRLAVDDVIAPGATREAVGAMIESLVTGSTPRFRHDNLPQ